MTRFLAAALVFVCMVVLGAHAFYLPGVAPMDYKPGDPVILKVNKLSSAKTQLPYDYYALPFCRPKKLYEFMENLGEILSGDRIENSAYDIKALEDLPCGMVCPPRKYEKDELKLFEERIKEEYRVHWIMDNLPAAVKRVMQDSEGNRTPFYEPGYLLGAPGEAVGGEKGKYYVNNHVHMTIRYHTPPTAKDPDSVRIVGFEVTPMSVRHDSELKDGVPKSCPPKAGVKPLSVSEATQTISWTYSVEWKPSQVRWATRWDVYLQMPDTQIHWFSIVNSLMIVLFLTGMVAMIMMRTLHADFRKYRELETQEEAQEETGWKLVHGDVFRPPQHALMLSVLFGNGAQVGVMCIITLAFAVLGFLSPANRGGLLTAMIVLYVLMGVFAGYAAARLYKMFKGVAWRRLTMTTALLVPGVVFAIFFVLNFAIQGKHSSGAVPFSTLVALTAMWFGVSVPLAYFGAYFGFKMPAVEHPVRTNQIPRQVPPQVWYMHPAVSILMGGILPFGAIFIELFFILSSIWLNQFYYLFGFLFIVFAILVLTCAEITVVMTYFQLCSEDYHWWWRSFLTSGASAFYMFAYTVFYFYTKLSITNPVGIMLYFGYTLILTLMFFVLTGSVGFMAAYVFVSKIFSNVHVD